VKPAPKSSLAVTLAALATLANDSGPAMIRVFAAASNHTTARL